MTLKEALDSGYCSLEDDFDFDDTPQGEEIACLKLEIGRLNNIINKVYKYLDEKKDVPEWWDTDFMICMDILKGGTGYLKDILGSDKE